MSYYIKNLHFLANAIKSSQSLLFNKSNIGLTFKSAPELLRRLGVVFASSSSKNHDKGFIRLKHVLGFFFNL